MKPALVATHFHTSASYSTFKQTDDSVIAMKSNANLRISGRSVVLVPYRQEHVQTYHAWMVSISFFKATGSR